ncbi:MAG: hypothetical protein ACT4PT_04150 [Methanobacteriota archaeon]
MTEWDVRRLVAKADEEARRWDAEATICGVVVAGVGGLASVLPRFLRPLVPLPASPVFVFRYRAPAKEPTFVVVFHPRGTLRSAAAGPRDAEDRPLGPWTLDGADAIRRAAAADGGLRRALDAGAVPTVILRRPAEGNAAWRIVAARRAAGGGGGSVVIDAVTGDVVPARIV